MKNINGENKVKDVFTIKENAIYNFRIIFRVRFDCVYGLKMITNIYKHSIKGSKIKKSIKSCVFLLFKSINMRK